MRPDAFFNRTIPSSSFTSCEKESELEIFTINEKRATQPSLIYIYIYIYLMFQFHWAFKSLTLFVNILFRLH